MEKGGLIRKINASVCHAEGHIRSLLSQARLASGRLNLNAQARESLTKQISEYESILAAKDTSTYFNIHIIANKNNYFFNVPADMDFSYELLMLIVDGTATYSDIDVVRCNMVTKIGIHRCVYASLLDDIAYETWQINSKDFNDFDQAFNNAVNILDEITIYREDYISRLDPLDATDDIPPCEYGDEYYDADMMEYETKRYRAIMQTNFKQKDFKKMRKLYRLLMKYQIKTKPGATK